MENLYYKHNPIVKKIFFSMFVPTILMNLTTALASFADSIIISHYLGEMSLSVVTFSTPIYMIINTFAALFAVGGSISMGIYSGKGDKLKSNKSFSAAMQLLFIIGILMVFAGVFFDNEITSWLGAKEDIFDKVHSYSKVILIGSPVFLLNIGFAFFVRNDGAPRLSMIGMFLSIVINIVFDIVFIDVFNLGIAGAAYATVLGQLVSAIIIASHLFTKKNTLKFYFVTELSIIVRIIRNGFSAALHFIYQFLSVFVINHYVVKLSGNDGMVIYSVVFNLYTVSLSLFEGLSQTIQPMISLYYGEKSNKQIKDTLRMAFLATVVICGSITTIVEVIPEIIPKIFKVNDIVLLNQSATAVAIFGSSIIIMTINVIMCYYLQSIECNFISSLLVSLRCFLLFLGIAFILGNFFGINGVWASYTVAELLTFIICILIIQLKRKSRLNKGILLDSYLLDTKIEENTKTLIYYLESENYENYVQKVINELKSNHSIKENICLDTKQYLMYFKNSVLNQKNTCIEVEIITLEQIKIIIRDNLNCRRIEGDINSIIKNGSKIDYSPALGWNIVYLQE